MSDYKQQLEDMRASMWKWFDKCEELDATATRLRGLLRRCVADAEYCQICEGNLYADLRDKSRMGHAADCELAEELKDE